MLEAMKNRLMVPWASHAVATLNENGTPQCGACGSILLSSAPGEIRCNCGWAGPLPQVKNNLTDLITATRRLSRLATASVAFSLLFSLAGISWLAWFVVHSTSTASPVRVAAPPEHVEIIPPRFIERSMPKEEWAAYEQAAASAGVVNIALLNGKLDVAIADLHLPVYGFSNVRSFLNQEFKGNENWCWRPLRKVDQDAHITYGDTPADQKIQRIDNGQVYSGAVPIAVLKTVDAIAQVVPQARFYVSESTAVGDPFLNVLIVGGNSYVIAQWDKPSYQ